MSDRPSAMQTMRSVRRFGLRHGLVNCARMVLPGTTTNLSIGGGRTVTLRRDTSDWETFSEVFLDQTYSDDFLCLFGAEPASGQVRAIVDAGANVGFASIYFRSRYPNADVWAIEPDVANYQQLIRNTSIDGRIHPTLGALWNQHETVNVVGESTAANSLRVTSSDDGDSLVQGYTVDDLLGMIPEHHIDVFKIDIEGAERFVFDDGASSGWLEHVGLLLIELHDWKQAGCTRAYHAALSRFDYSEFAGAGTIGTLIRGPSLT